MVEGATNEGASRIASPTATSSGTSAAREWLSHEFEFLRRLVSAAIRILAIIVIWKLHAFVPVFEAETSFGKAQHGLIVGAFTTANAWLAFDVAFLLAPNAWRRRLGL